MAVGVLAKLGLGEKGKEQMAKAKQAHIDRANKRKEAKAAAEGKTLDEKKAEVNAPYLATQKNIAKGSLADSNNNNTFDDASIKLDETQLPSARDPNVTETAAQTQAKLDSPSEISVAPSVEQTTSDEIEEKAEEVAQKDPRARYKVSSIWDAYRSGAIDSDTRDYMMLDAIRTSVNNFAQDQGKIAAAYGGGSFDANYQDSAWDARNKEMLKQGISSEAATVEGSDKEMERQLQRIQAAAGNLNNEQKGYMLGASRTLAKLSKEAKTNVEKAMLSAMAADVADGNIDGKGLIAIAGATGIKDLKEWLTGDDK